MTSHPNFDRAQAALDAARHGNYAPAFDAFADDVLVENGPRRWALALGLRQGRPGAAAGVRGVGGQQLPLS
jgi:hypothetical protein